MVKQHTGLKVLGILSVIAGILAVIGGLYYVSIGGIIEEAGQNSIIGIIALIPVGMTLVAMGGAMIVVGLVLAFLGYKVYKHKSWAYWVYFILTIVGFVGSLYAVSWLGILIGGIIMWYLYSIRKTFMKSSDYRPTWSD